MDKITWVRGNRLRFVVPLQTKTAVDGEWVTEDYVPPAGSVTKVWMTGPVTKEYEHTVEGNIVRFEDNGTLPVGLYGIEIRVREPAPDGGAADGRRLRTFKCKKVEIVNCSDTLGMVGPDGETLLDAALFVQGEKGEKGEKGDKGDPGTTDYNELENKPDLSIYLQQVSEEQFNEIFS